MTNVPHPIGVGGGCSCATVQQAALLAASTPAAANCVLVGCGVLGSASGRQVYGAAETHQHRIKRGCSVVVAFRDMATDAAAAGCFGRCAPRSITTAAEPVSQKCTS